MMKLILSHYKRILGHNKINDLISPVSSYHHGDTFKLGFTLDHLTLWPCHGFTGTLRTVQNNSINASYIRIRLKWHHLKSATEGAALSMVGSRRLLSFLYNGHFRQTFRGEFVVILEFNFKWSLFFRDGRPQSHPRLFPESYCILGLRVTLF